MSSSQKFTEENFELFYTFVKDFLKEKEMYQEFTAADMFTVCNIASSLTNASQLAELENTLSNIFNIMSYSLN